MTFCRRFGFLFLFLFIFFVFVLLSLYKLRDSIAFYKTPSEVLSLTNNSKHIVKLKIGGYVCPGSVKTDENSDISFFISDSKSKIEVFYSGMLPPMFSEGTGVVATGVLSANGVFIAEDLLSKHDEKYSPRKVSSR